MERGNEINCLLMECPEKGPPGWEMIICWLLCIWLQRTCKHSVVFLHQLFGLTIWCAVLTLSILLSKFNLYISEKTKQGLKHNGKESITIVTYSSYIDWVQVCFFDYGYWKLDFSEFNCLSSYKVGHPVTVNMCSR